MAIDSNALDSIHAAIKSYSGETVSNKKEPSDLLSAINSNSQGLIKQTRYKTEFEEKMKIANSSEDYVKISDKSLDALQKYVKKETNATNKQDSSSSSGYTYDYQAIKKKNLENQAAIEKDVADKYGKKTTADTTASSVTKPEDSTKASETAKPTEVSDVASKSASEIETEQMEAKTTVDTSTQTTGKQASTTTTSTEDTTTQYTYDYFTKKQADEQKANQIAQEISQRYSGKESSDSIVE